MDVLFLHTPKFDNYYKPIGQFSFVLFPPIGLLGLADYLTKNKRTARIIHLGVEQQQSGQVDLERIVAENQPAIVGLDLHWHFQSYDVIEVARKIKLAHPEVAILLGGFTASLFAEEILTDFPLVDFVIRGDAEIPLLQLVLHFESDKTYGEVPNLAYRQGSGVVLNPTTYVADSAMLDSMCFTDFTLIKDYPCFVKSFSRYMHIPGLSEPFQHLLFGWHKGFQVYIGRGCVHDCCFCGGSYEAHTLIGGRRRVALRSVDSIVSSIRDLARFGFDSACLALDSCPLEQADDYYLAIFEELKRLNIGLDIEVERYFLPSARFLESFRELPGKGSFVTLSPHTQNERLRRENGLYRYSNQEIEQCLVAMEDLGVNSLLCFTCGLPFETREDLESMAEYQRHLRKRFKRMRFKTCMIEIEPGSNMSRNPSKYGLQLERTSFADYYRYHSQPSQNHWLEMGYARRDCPDHAEVSEFFCSHFCERFKAGWASPAICNSVAALWKVGAFRALDKILALKEKS
jgi:radical SAM superfamily enzyme YgiQ (UPF0313 family)